MTIGQLLQLARQKLTGQSEAPDDARSEAEILLARALEVRRSFLYTHPDSEVPRKRQIHFINLVKSRCKGTPIAYLTGVRPFWTLNLQVTPAVLIPRHETELVVDKALQLIPPGVHRRIADLGTGSGAIALSIAQERPNCEVHASDCSLEALKVAQENARLNDLKRVKFHYGSWTEPLSGTFDLIASNPPYIAQNDPHLQTGDCRFEPHIALASGVDGLTAIRQITSQALPLLASGGWLILEHGYDQGEAVRSIMQAAGYSEVETSHDLAGIERVCLGKRN